MFLTQCRTVLPVGIRSASGYFRLPSKAISRSRTSSPYFFDLPDTNSLVKGTSKNFFHTPGMLPGLADLGVFLAPQQMLPS